LKSCSEQASCRQVISAFNQRVFDVILSPLMDQAYRAAPLLVESNEKLGAGFHQAARLNRLNIEAVYTGYQDVKQNGIPHFQINARVFVQKF
jgi:hypothetical protein